MVATIATVSLGIVVTVGIAAFYIVNKNLT